MTRTVNRQRHLQLARDAFEVVRRRGVHRTSMSDIARELGIKRPTLYWYFKDLSSIFEARLEQTLEEQTQYLLQRLDGIEHPLDRLEEFLFATCDFYRGKEDFMVLMIQLWARQGVDPGPIFSRFNESFQLVRSLAVQELAQGIDNGQVAACDPEILVDSVAAFTDGLLLHRLARGLDIDPLQRAFIARVLTPLRVRQTTEIDDR